MTAVRSRARRRLSRIFAADSESPNAVAASRVVNPSNAVIARSVASAGRAAAIASRNAIRCSCSRSAIGSAGSGTIGGAGKADRNRSYRRLARAAFLDMFCAVTISQGSNDPSTNRTASRRRHNSRNVAAREILRARRAVPARDQVAVDPVAVPVPDRAVPATVARQHQPPHRLIRVVHHTS